MRHFLVHDSCLKGRLLKTYLQFIEEEATAKWARSQIRPSLINGVQGTHNLIKKVVGHCLLYCPNHSCAINAEIIVLDSFAEPEGPNDLGFLIVQEVVRQFNGIVADAVFQCCLNGI